MSGFFRRLRNTFKRNRPSSNSIENVDDENIENTNTGLPYRQNEDLNDSNDEIGSVTYNNRPLQTNFRRPQREVISADEYSSTSSLNVRNSELRKESNDFQSDSSRNNKMNRNVNPSVNNNDISITNPTTQERLSLQSQSEDRASRQPQNITPQLPTNNLSPQQLPMPSTNQILQSRMRNHFLAGINRNRRPIEISRNSTLVDFPRGLNPRLNQRLQNSSNGFNRPFLSNRLNRSSFVPRLVPFQSQNKIFNYAIDYPIENVLIDENIPSSMAIKINEAIEYDRFGNAYYNHHYAYEPTVQHMNFDNNQQIDRHVIRNSHPKGMRYIREIKNDPSFSQGNYDCYPRKTNDQIFQTKHLNNLQLMIDNIPEVNYQLISSQNNFNCYPIPINHFTACALSYDPMQIE
ncbi:unnamed protein product [Rotaria sp. Silwood2]|nr:unnamed protein product [Rotaria sp. Silwood2]CAF4532206.1 unnamed protein product [Rotaria sp. Silwood2]